MYADKIILAHCDWSMHAGKRWMTTAIRHDGVWSISAPELVGDVTTLLDRLRQRGDGVIVIGFDFPIGLPKTYGEKSGLIDFRSALTSFGQGVWSDWYSVAELREDISLHRPFYPRRPGGTKRSHLMEGLGLESTDALLRRCERATEDRQAACMLFWTLGGNQVGKGAITGWREILTPNLTTAGLWPFDGNLDQLLSTHAVVFAETYPASVYSQLGISRRPLWSKRLRDGRTMVARHLMAWLRSRPVRVEPPFVTLVSQGFSAGSDGEDQFDAAVGLFGMIDVLDGRQPEGAPKDPAIQRWEGWILGQQ